MPKTSRPAVGIEIKRLKPEDIFEVHALWKEAGLPFKPEGRDALGIMGKEMRETETVLAGAYLGEALVGVVLATSESRKGWVNRLAVRPGYRNRGIAGKLVAYCEALFRGRGIGIVSILVEEENPDGLRFFKELGYEVRRDITYLRKMLQEKW